jgi:hypothetical protein
MARRSEYTNPGMNAIVRNRIARSAVLRECVYISAKKDLQFTDNTETLLLSVWDTLPDELDMPRNGSRPEQRAVMRS